MKDQQLLCEVGRTHVLWRCLAIKPQRLRTFWNGATHGGSKRRRICASRAYPHQPCTRVYLQRLFSGPHPLCRWTGKPRRTVQQVYPLIAHQLLKPSIAFFSITLNEFDVLLVVDEEAGREFRQRSTPKEADQAQNDSAPDNQLRGENTQNEGNDFEFEPPSNGVQVSRIQWTALSLDVSRSPARLCTISEAMKAAGIPIIYQSAMNCDYLFVSHFGLQL